MWPALQTEVMDLVVKCSAFTELFSTESPGSSHNVEPLRQLRDNLVHQHKHELVSTSLALSDNRELRKLLHAVQLGTPQRVLPDTDGEKVLGHDRTKPSASQPLQSDDSGAQETQGGRTRSDSGSVDRAVRNFRSEDMKTFRDFRSVDMRTFGDSRSEDMRTVKDCGSEDMRTVKDCGSEDMRTVKDFRSVDMKVKDCKSVDMKVKDCKSVDMKVKDCKSVDMRTVSDSGSENGTVKDCGSVNMRKVKDCGSVNMRKVKDCGSVEMRTIKDCGSMDMKVDDFRSVDTRTTRDFKSEDGSDGMHREREEEAVCGSSQHGSEELRPSVTTGFWKCMRCQGDIRDRYLVQVNDGRRVHERCLVCQVCDTAMDTATTRSIFLLHNNILCKDHYTQMLSAKRKSSVCCAECREEIRAGKDWVRLAGQQVYHVTCFACSQCGVQFANGALFILRNGRPVCHMHFSDSPEQQGRVAARRVKRTRTQFTEQQYRALQRYFRDGTNPDGRRLQTIASELGLVKRHVQVWFQNNRARQKKLAESRHG